MPVNLKFLSIITTYRCNFQCHMCNIWGHPTRKQEEFTASDLVRLPPVKTINLTGGEPFLREDLSELITVLLPKTKRIVISTNGYFSEKILALARRHPSVGFRISVEGLPAVNDDLRGVKDGFDHAIATLAELRHIGCSDIGFGITLSDRNIESLLPLYHLSKMMRVEFATAAVHNSFYFHKNDNRIGRGSDACDQLDRLITELLSSHHLKDWFRAYFNHGLKQYVMGKPRVLPCSMGKDAAFIDPTGEVLPCNGMQSPVSFGNIRGSSFEDLWHSPQAERVRTATQQCDRRCWMMGSASEPIKTNLAQVIRWIAREKRSRSSRSSCAASCDAAHGVCQESCHED